MKKALSILLVLVMLVSCSGVFADKATSEAMEASLLSIKPKFDVPEDFSEFSAYSTENDDEVTYNFVWEREDGSGIIEVSCVENGPVLRYYFHDRTLQSDKKMTALSKDDILKLADDFIRRLVPEAFADENDCLVYEEESWSVSNLNYNIYYNRYKNGVRVKNNSADIAISVYDDVAYIRSVNVEFYYDEKFQEPAVEIEDYVQKYMEAYPIELVYRDKNQLWYYDEEENETVLVYRHKDNDYGYISAYTGEIVEEEFMLYYGASGGGSAEDSTASKNEAVLREEEIEELEKISGLMSVEEGEKILKALPYVDFENSLELEATNIRSRDDVYYITVRYGKDERWLTATFDGMADKLTNLSNGFEYSDEKVDELTEAEKEAALKNTEKFLSKACEEELLQSKIVDQYSYDDRFVAEYDRYVNGVRYINNGILVTFDAGRNKIIRYSLDFDNKVEFASPDEVIAPNVAYKCLFDISPLEKIYVFSGGEYKLCYMLTQGGVQLDAFTGEKYNEYEYADDESYEYTDIKGHWAESKVNKLAEIQIGLEGERFNPDAPITQYDLLRLFGAGICYKSYLTFPVDDLYENLIYDKILTEEEKNPEGQVLREDAFVYMVRMDGLEKVAKLSDIYKVEYADGHLLSPGKIGYPAILTGMNIICGNGGYLKPDQPITRAEAAVMVYNYMNRN